jgi:hypothetical protein
MLIIWNINIQITSSFKIGGSVVIQAQSNVVSRIYMYVVRINVYACKCMYIDGQIMKMYDYITNIQVSTTQTQSGKYSVSNIIHTHLI